MARGPTIVVVVGNSRSARMVAAMLDRTTRERVVLVDSDDLGAEAVQGDEVATVRGEHCQPETLRRAGVGPCTRVLALTDDEESNFLIATIAQKVLDATVTIARVDDSERGGLWKAFHVDTVNPDELATGALVRPLTAGDGA